MTFAALSAFTEEFLALQRAIAKHKLHQNGRHRRCLRHREKLLRSFLAYWRKHGSPWPIRRALVMNWIAVGSNRQHPYRDDLRFQVARAFLRQVRVFEPATEIPDNIYGPRNRRGTPYVYSDQEIARLMNAVSQLRLVDALRPLTFLLQKFLHVRQDLISAGYGRPRDGSRFSFGTDDTERSFQQFHQVRHLWPTQRMD